MLGDEILLKLIFGTWRTPNLIEYYNFTDSCSELSEGTWYTLLCTLIWENMNQKARMNVLT